MPDKTIAELKAELDLLGVAYKASAKKAELEALLEGQTASDDAPEVEAPDEEDENLPPPDDVLRAKPANAKEYITCPACSHSAPSADFPRSYA